MKTRFVFALVFLAGSAFAQDSLLQPMKDEVLIGPVSIETPVAGIPIVTNASCFTNIKTQNGDLELKARVVADLSDLQKKVGSLIDTIPLPTDNCSHYGLDNVVARIWGKQLTVDGNNGVLKLSGDVDVWTCAKNPIPCTRVEMVDERVFGVVVSVPKVIAYDCNAPIKNRNVNQPFDAVLPFSLTTTDPHTIAIRLGQPSVNLGGTLGGVTNGILKIAGVDINGRVQAALQSAIGPELLQKTLPPDLLRLNPKITHAALFDNGGRMAARVHLAANVPGAVMTDLLKVLVDKPTATAPSPVSGSSK